MDNPDAELMDRPDAELHTSLGINEILKILPHRYPFLLVDRIEEINLEEGYIVGRKNLTMNEPFFQGHFPGAPVMPGVLIVEALAQTGAVYIYKKGYHDKVAALLSVNHAKFRHPVHPGDTLEMRCEGVRMGNRAGRVKAIAKVDGHIAAEAEIGFVLLNKGKL